MNTWLTEGVAFLLLVALSAYVLFGGADFGGGILEGALPTSRLRKKLQLTLAPVWEANHVWLIAVVVILFVGFPKFYAQGLTRLFIPISLALLGILLRGSFFTLRKYDPAPSVWLSRLYSALFRISSVIAPFAFGLVVAGLLSVHPGSVDRVPLNAEFAAVYLNPWLNGFGVLCGLFVAALFAYLAAVFFFGEVSDASERMVIWRRARLFLAASFVLGGAVLLTGAWSGRVSLLAALSPVQVTCQLLATIGIAALVIARRAGRLWWMRFAAGGQVLAILVGWFHAQSPVLLRTELGVLTIDAAAAPPITLMWLAAGLVTALVLVVPSLVWLYRVFSMSETATR